MSASDFYHSQFNRLVENYRFDLTRRIENLRSSGALNARADVYESALKIFNAHVEEVTSPAVAKRKPTIRPGALTTVRNNTTILLPPGQAPDTNTVPIDLKEFVATLHNKQLFTIKAPE